MGTRLLVSDGFCAGYSSSGAGHSELRFLNIPAQGSSITANILTMNTVNQAQNLFESTVYAVLDFETTGLNPKRGDRAIELGISLCENGQEIDTFSSLINPGMRIDPFITHLTGISNSMVAAAPPASEVMKNAMHFIGNAQLVAHNASFDKKFWRNELSQEFNIEDGREFLCTLMLSRRIFQSFPSHRLGEIARSLGIPVSQSHRALADAQVTAQVLFTIIAHLRAASSGECIDAMLLRSYQKRSRAALPDLTTQKQIEVAIDQAFSARSRKKATSKLRNSARVIS